jgi:ATP synthase protein I
MPLPPADQVRSLGALSAVGLAFVLAIGMGVGAGIWLDRQLGTSPWLLFLGLGLGFAAGVLNIYKATRRL